MTHPAPLTRRAALAGAALMVGDLGASSARAVEDGDPPGHCCGNGPPNMRIYGGGIHPVLTSVCEDSSVVFENPMWGDGGLLGQYYYVFVPDVDVKVTEYIDPQGVSHTPKHYTVAGYSGIIYRIEPGFTLGLEWPGGVTPDFSTRPLGRKEGGNP